ncbi:M15 family metallopeptidase [Testudinibacter sp. TR-2022]|uniref:M15 family metallopeptidase n=1 Tax=Testudinibacter sp. TR-2022 TaxID=2585029 RepID=UPI00111899FD|nr:M15 family metallopeptidase [Testudinibacter sp. TR-2022]TNH06642.1 M15 family metallopeptidase [Pasteurellaceae bacterium Phil11]TNH25521.1 M15 family metallopeptidase [Testudinibacter sp. TR-2022]TNH25701.1 M15 family metallopeptidase [Testudinibacter sp. TR-2022]
MSNFKLSTRSEMRMVGVHDELKKVVRRAIQLTSVDFAVIEGKRTRQRQAELFKQGATKTMNSRHLTGHAVDLAPMIDGQIPWADKSKFNAVAKAMFTAAAELNIKIRWGGDWNENGRSDDERFYDGPHFELTWRAYP